MCHGYYGWSYLCSERMRLSAIQNLISDFIPVTQCRNTDGQFSLRRFLTEAGTQGSRKIRHIGASRTGGGCRYFTHGRCTVGQEHGISFGETCCIVGQIAGNDNDRFVRCMPCIDNAVKHRRGETILGCWIQAGEIIDPVNLPVAQLSP